MNKLIRYLIISLAVILIFIGLGYLTYSIFEAPFPALRMEGGEINVYVGIGYTVEKYYPLVSVFDTNDYTRSKFFISFVSIITCTVIFTAIQLVIASVRKKRKNRSSDHISS